MNRFLISALLIFGIPTLGISQGIQVSPVKMYFNLNPGETKTQSIQLTNQSDENKLFEISLSDWERDSLGNKIYAPIGSLKNSCSDWMVVRPNIVRLNANETKDIQITMSRPQGSEKDLSAKCSMVFVKEIKEQEGIQAPSSTMEARMLIEYRLGVHVYQNSPSNTLKSIEIEGFQLDVSSDKKSKKLMLKLKNNGNQITDSYVKIELTNNATGNEIKLDPVSVAMMPGTQRFVTIELPKTLPSGEYTVLGIIDNGPEVELKIAELEIKL